MKKSMLKKMKRFTALAVGATLLLQSVAFANPLPTHLQGTGTVVNPVFAVLLPTAPAIRVNPLQIGSTLASGLATIPNPGVGDPGHVPGDPPPATIPNPGVAVVANIPNPSPGAPYHVPGDPPPATIPNPGYTPAVTNPQVTSDWFVVANRSSVPVNVHMRVGSATTAADATRATFVASALAAHAVGTDRNAFLQVEFAENVATALPTGVTGTAVITNAATAANLSALNWAARNHATEGRIPLITPVDGLAAAMTGGHETNILLGAHRYNITPAGVQTIVAGTMNADQYTAFRFDGAVNPRATWGAGAVTTRIVFTITGISPVNFAAIESAPGTTGKTGAHRVFTAVDLTATP